MERPFGAFHLYFQKPANKYQAITTTSEITEIKNQRLIPSKNGRTPTLFTLSTESPQPIKNKVAAKACLEQVTMPVESHSGIFANVLQSIAPINKNMNHGIEIFLPLLRNMLSWLTII